MKRAIVENGEIRYEELTSEEEAAHERDEAEWGASIRARADIELNKGITIPYNGVDYLVASDASARSLIAGAGLAADKAIREGRSITRRIPTDKGIVTVGENELEALFNIVDDHHEAIMARVEELHAKAADGTITEADLETGWP